MRYRIKLSYNGAGFNGWQFQPNAPSVQEALERALERLTGTKTAVTGAGRTDTGVNAAGYVAHFDAAEGLDCRQIAYKLNAILPKSISILEIIPAEEGFHARFGATRREYTYFLHKVKDPFVQNWSYHYGYPGLDIDAMNRAAEMLLGTHDFSCFEKTGGDNRTSVCTVFEAFWAPYTPVISAGGINVLPSSPDLRRQSRVNDTSDSGSSVHKSSNGSFIRDDAHDGNYLYFRISADRFLRNMVRATVGTLLEIGRGKRSVESLAETLRSGDRCAAGESVPGHALFLSEIDYF